MIVGALLLVHAAVLVAMAVRLSTARSSRVHQPVGWAILAVGVAACSGTAGGLSTQSYPAIVPDTPGPG